MKGARVTMVTVCSAIVRTEQPVTTISAIGGAADKGVVGRLHLAETATDQNGTTTCYAAPASTARHQHFREARNVHEGRIGATVDAFFQLGSGIVIIP